MQNDTATDIRAGQVWERRGKVLTHTRFVRGVMNGEVIYQDIFMQTCASTVDNFRRWTRGAKLVKEGDL